MGHILIKGANIVNEGKIFKGDVLIYNDIIDHIATDSYYAFPSDTKVIDATGLYLIPGVIDTHVHFREPGLTHKADIYSESRAAAAGGVTSFMDMPNTNPQTITIEALEDKYRLAEEKSLINYSFYIGATNSNQAEIDKVDPTKVCGIKLFMGSSTGNMLVDNYEALSTLFKNASLPIVAHCEDENIIKRNSETFRQLFGEDIPISYHPLIRDRKACLTSSEKAIRLALKYDSQLHIAHVTTADEVELFSNDIPLSSKKITAEACIGHICLDDSMYDALGTLMKVNPAIKTVRDKEKIIQGIINNSIDTIATDHAPHILSEKKASYFKAPSGAPVVQHSLVAMLELWKNGIISLEKIVEKMCHNPAIIFNIQKRGFIKKGFKADLCLFNPNNSWTVSSENIYHKCGWSLFDNQTFNTSVETTIVNGNVVYQKGLFIEDNMGERLSFNR